MADQNAEVPVVPEASTSTTPAPCTSANQAPTTRAAQHKRSWSGCARCKKRRQKCDENRPECGRCKAANVECVYEVKLRWGGRAFNQSRFGACISDTKTASKDKVKKLGSVDKGFIYTVNSFQVQPQPPRVTAPPTPAVQDAVPIEQLSEEPNLQDLPPLDLDLDDSFALIPATPPGGIQLDDYDMDFFPLFTPVDPFVNLGTLDRSLLDHFINETSHVISCHSKVQEDVCRVIVPAALQSPTLFYATAALSAIHHKSRQGFGSDTVRQDPLISRLLTNSLFGLQSDLLEKDVNKSSVLLATIRTLFLCEVHAGGDRPGTWRAHFEGAKALMLDIESWQGYSSRQRDSTRYFLKRWYNMTESFVALTTDGLASGQLARFGPRTLDGDEEEKVYLDEYAGFATDLTPIFREIGAAAWERRNDTQPTILEEGDLDEEAASLTRCIWTRLDEAKLRTPKFRPGVEEQLSARQKADFLSCNEIWHHMALIYIYRRISNHAASSPPVQSSVRTILTCIESLTATPGLTPLVVMTTPLFAAGCEAQGKDRDRVRCLLRNMFHLLHIPNIHRSSEVLESFWASSTERGEAIDWDSFMHDQNWDFLPY